MSRRPLALYSIAAVFVAIVLVLLVLDYQRSMVVSDVRAYIAGEGLYSKSQKRAVNLLFRYVRLGSEEYYLGFRDALLVPQGDRDARLALQKSSPDFEAARKGFLQGRNHPADVDRMAGFFVNFHRVSYVADAIAIWTQGDREIAHLEALGAQVHSAMAAGVERPALNPILQDVADTDERLTVLEDQFSTTLGEGARFVVEVTEIAVLALTTIMLGLGLVFSLRVVGQTRKAEAALNQANTALQNRTRQFETLINQAPVGVYLVDSNFFIRQVNPVAEPFFGNVRGGAVQRKFDEIAHLLWTGDYADEVVQIFHRTLDTGEAHVTPECAEYRIDRGVTEYYERRLDRITLPDGRYGVVCYFRDISAQVLARRAIEESREALREADRRKDEFLATLAHELRNPLAPIRTGLHVMKLARDDPAELARALRIVDRQTELLVTLVDDLLDVSRITRGKLQLHRRRVRLGEVIDGAVDASRPMINDADNELAVDISDGQIWVDADPHRLTQIISNLLNNAARYTRPGGRISLSAKRSNSDLVLSVQDTGEGIAPDMLERVFEMFTQVDRPESFGGLGIGLTLVKSLVELHGGTVSAESGGLGKGSTFEVVIPIIANSRMQDERVPQAEQNNASVAKHRVLIVDDNADAAETLTVLVGMLGHEVQQTNSPVNVLDIASQWRPDVILLDLGMPGMNGYEVAQQIRGQAWGKNMMLVAVTGWGQEADKQRTRNAGFDFHLVKPADFDRLKAILDMPGPAAAIERTADTSL
jgi:PAS domain S-box-containing protein